MPSDRVVSRRRFVAAAGGTLATSIAGCLQTGGDSTADLSHPFLGSADSDVVVEVFEDFACPHCKTYNNNVVPQLYENFITPGEIKYVHRDFPIPVSKWSWRVANAARSIQANMGREQFWVFTFNAYRNQESYSESTIKQIVNEMDGPADQVISDMKSQAYRGTIQADKQAGKQLGVNSTPAIFVNETPVDNGYEQIRTAIQSEKS